MLYTNVGLKKPELTDSADIRVAVGDNMDLLNGMVIPYGGTTTNTGNAYAISSPAIGSLTAGIAVSFMVNADSTGAATLNWDSTGAVSIKKPNGSDVTNLKANGIYTVRYNGTNFILQGSDSAGNATTGDVLAGKTFSNDSDTDLTGTMPNRAGDNTALASSVSGTTLKLRAPSGFYDGTDDNVTITDADFTAGNIKNDVNLFGITGNYEGLKLISRQYGSQAIAPSDTNINVTISSVTESNCVAFHASYGDARNERMRCHVTASTTLNMYRTATTSYSHTEYWEVLEFDPDCIVSIQTGTVSGSNPNTVTISSVDINKSMLFYSMGGGGTGTLTPEYGRIISSTSIELYGDTTGLWRWYVVEFK